MEKEKTPEQTRNECLEAVAGPGKFECEQIFSPYFYDILMNGCSNDEVYLDNLFSGIHITKADLVIFPELSKTYGVICYESDQGFFYCVTYDTKQDYDDEIKHLENQTECENDE